MRAAAAALLVAVAGFGFDPLDRCAPAAAGGSLACPMPGYTDRAFDIDVPAGWDGGAPPPLMTAPAAGRCATCAPGTSAAAFCTGRRQAAPRAA